jgi:hypothetical protein
VFVFIYPRLSVILLSSIYLVFADVTSIFSAEDGGSMYFETMSTHKSTRCHYPGHQNRHLYFCEILEFYLGPVSFHLRFSVPFSPSFTIRQLVRENVVTYLPVPAIASLVFRRDRLLTVTDRNTELQRQCPLWQGWRLG